MGEHPPRRSSSLSVLVRAAFLLSAVAGAASAQASRRTPGFSNVHAPPVIPVGPADVTIEVRSAAYSSAPGLPQVVILGDPGDPLDDIVFQDDDPSMSGDQPLRFPLVVALRKADELNVSPCVIGVFGSLPGSSIQIGGGDAGLKAYRAEWGTTPMVFTVLGRTLDAELLDFVIAKDLSDGTPTGGVADGRFEALTLTASDVTGDAAVFVPEQDTFGVLRLYDCVLRPESTQGHAGYGWKWGVRGHGYGSYDFRRLAFAPVLEHCVYVDALQGDSYFVDLVHAESTRTAIQLVARAFECPLTEPERTACLDDFESGATLPNPSSNGTLLIDRLSVGNLYGAGGSAVTIVGHLGDIVLRDLSMVSTSQSHGAVVIYTDGVHGAHLRTTPGGDLYSNGVVHLEDFEIDLAAPDRDLILISGARGVHVPAATRLSTPIRKGFAFDASLQMYDFQDELCVVDGVVQRFTGTVPLVVDPVFYLRAPLSQNSIWDVGTKIQRMTTILTDDEVDALNYTRYVVR